jgi:hypothetical protein
MVRESQFSTHRRRSPLTPRLHFNMARVSAPPSAGATRPSRPRGEVAEIRAALAALASPSAGGQAERAARTREVFKKIVHHTTVGIDLSDLFMQVCKKGWVVWVWVGVGVGMCGCVWVCVPWRRRTRRRTKREKKKTNAPALGLNVHPRPLLAGRRRCRPRWG